MRGHVGCIVSPTIIIINGSAIGCAVGCSVNCSVGHVVGGAAISTPTRDRKSDYVLWAFGRAISHAAYRAVSYMCCQWCYRLHCRRFCSMLSAALSPSTVPSNTDNYPISRATGYALSAVPSILLSAAPIAVPPDSLSAEPSASPPTLSAARHYRL